MKKLLFVLLLFCLVGALPASSEEEREQALHMMFGIPFGLTEAGVTAAALESAQMPIFQAVDRRADVPPNTDYWFDRSVPLEYLGKRVDEVRFRFFYPELDENGRGVGDATYQDGLISFANYRATDETTAMLATSQNFQDFSDLCSALYEKYGVPDVCYIGYNDDGGYYEPAELNEGQPDFAKLMGWLNQGRLIHTTIAYGNMALVNEMCMNDIANGGRIVCFHNTLRFQDAPVGWPDHLSTLQ